MKTSFIFLLFFSFFLKYVTTEIVEGELSISIEGNIHLARFAIKSIFHEYLEQTSQKVDVIFFGNQSTEMEDIVNQILTNSEKSSIQVSQFSLENHWRRKLNISSILIFESRLYFQNFCKYIKWVGDKRTRHNHLVYAPNISVSDITSNVKNGLDIDAVGFLMNETSESIELVSSFMFTKKICRENQFLVVNRFQSKKMNWEKSTFYPKKYLDFHRCLLNVGKLGPNYQVTKIFHQLAKIRNFRMNRTMINLHDASKGISEFDLVDTLATFKEDLDYITSVPYMINVMTFAIPPGEEYTMLEKMFLMYDVEVWIAIVVTLSIGLVTIQVVNCMSIKIRNFVYGRNIKTPTMNLVSIFLNGGQLRVPGRNFARFLFVLFIIWSLIIRTCYQSELFKYLQADRRPIVKSFDEMVARGFTLYGPLNIVENYFGKVLNGYFHHKSAFKLELFLTIE